MYVIILYVCTHITHVCTYGVCIRMCTNTYAYILRLSTINEFVYMPASPSFTRSFISYSCLFSLVTFALAQVCERVCVCLCLGLGLCDVRVFVISNTQTYLLRRIHAPVIKIQLHTYLYSICIHKKGNWIKWFDWLTKVFFYSSIAYTVHISFVFSRFLSQVSSLT